MTQWIFVAAAYGITLIATALVSFISWRAMRNAESQADRLSDRS